MKFFLFLPFPLRTKIEVCIHGKTGPNLIVSNTFATRHKPDFGSAAKARAQGEATFGDLITRASSGNPESLRGFPNGG